VSAPRLTDAQRADLLLSLWWSHDGQWMLKTRDAHGLADAMERNEDVIESMGRIEMRQLHRALGAGEVTDAGHFLPLAVAAHDLIGLPADGAMEGSDGFLLRVPQCRVWTMTERADLTAQAPGCAGSLRRRMGWASVFFAVDRVRWERAYGRPDGDPDCGYRFRLAPASG